MTRPGVPVSAAASTSPVERSSATRFALGLLVVLAGSITLVLSRDGRPLAVDIAVRRLLASEGSEVLEGLALPVTQLGAGPVLYPVLLLLSALRMRQRAGRPAWWAFLPVAALAAAQVVEGVLFVTIPRPSSGTGLSTSFSSGHTAAATLGWGLVVASMPVGRHGRAAGVAPGSAALPWLAAVGAGVLVGASRIVLGVHWVSDVLAALALGLLLLVGTAVVDARTAPRPAASLASATVRPPPTRGWPWLWLVPAAAALLSLVPLLLTPGRERLKDLLVYQGAGGAAGAGVDVYGFRTTFDMPFTYPPFAALLSEPLSRIPIGLGQLLWTAASLAALAGLAKVAMPSVVLRLGLPLTVAALLVAAPVRSHLRFGQVGLFLVLIVAVDLLSTDRGRGRSLGLGLGLAIAVKLTPAVFLPWLVATRSWRRLRATLLWLAGATLLGLVLLWRSATDYVFAAATDTSRFGPNDIPGNQSVRGMLLRSGLPEALVQPAWLVAALLLLAVGTVGARRLERARMRPAAVGVLACVSVAVSPISWVHHLVWLVLPIGSLAAAGRWKLAAAWYAVLVPGLPALGAAAASTGNGPPALWQLVTDLQGLTAVVAVVALPALCLRRPQPATSAADAVALEAATDPH